MKLYAPSYYKRFHCIADRCEHSCCIGWEIDIDEETLQTYKTLKDGYGAVVADSISTEDTPHFQLCEGDRCPHLDERGLCKIILNVGEGYLCQICHEHPRFYNYTDVAEVGIGLSCEEAARLVLSSSDYATMEEIGAVDAESDGIAFDGRAVRNDLYAALQDTTQDYANRLDTLYRKYGIDSGEDSRWLATINSLEYLDQDHKKLFMKYSSVHCPRDHDEYRERFLAYLIYRHCTEAVDEEDLAERLAFCLFCERLLTSLIETERAETPEDIARLARIISEEIEYSEDNTQKLTCKDRR